MDLAGHHRLVHFVPLEIADRGPKAGQAHPLKMLADAGQLRIGVSGHAQAVDLIALRVQGFGQQ